MSEVKPWLTVAYHALLLPELLQNNLEAVRTTYDGPLSMVIDLTVYNVSIDKIVVREAVTAELLYPPRPSREYGTAERADPINYTDWTNSGKRKGYTPPPMPEK